MADDGVTAPGDGPPPQPPAFGRAWTIGATILLAALLAGSVAIKEGIGLIPYSADPLAAFDAMIQRERIGEPLRPADARDAEKTLNAILARRFSPSEGTRVTQGARARLAVVQAETGRWPAARNQLDALGGSQDFIRVMNCAYGPDAMACGPEPACEPEGLRRMEETAGPWAARRACLVEAQKQGNTATVARLGQDAPARAAANRRGIRFLAINGSLLGAACAAGVVLVRRRRRATAPQPPPAALPAPWSLGQLYAALVRSAMTPLLWSCLIALFVTLAKAPMEPTFGIALYLLAGWWVARLVFQRFGLSWRDGFRVRPGGDWRGAGHIVLVALAAIGIDRAGNVAISLLESNLGQSVRWADRLPPMASGASVTLLGHVVELVILAPLVEEVVFRRAIFASLRRRWAFPWAALASAVVFTLPHAYGVVGTSTVLWTGLVTAWAYDRSQNLWPSLLVHMVNNSLATLGSLT